MTAVWIYDRKYNYGSGLPIKQVHGFVLDKPARILARLVEAHGLDPETVVRPTTATRAELARVHDEALLDALDDQTAVARAVELLPLRWLPRALVRRAVVDPQILAAGGTIAALRRALGPGAPFVFNLSGGYHHARPSLSHGFCLVNDVATAVAAVRAEDKLDPRVLVLDLDLHQGDGNAAAFAGDERVFTASMHESAAFPHPKLESDLDVGLRSHVGDAYLDELDGLLEELGARFAAPDVVIYVAGTDPYEADPLGSLGVSAEAMVERDRRVGAWAVEQGAALVALPSGGYTAHSPVLNADGFAAMAAERAAAR